MSRNLPAERPVAVIKIGGSILKSVKAYRRAARFLRNRHRAAPCESLVVVVSAQEGATDRLERAAKEIVREPNPKALDLLWATGELRSVALVALHLQALGVSAAGLNVHEAGLQVSGESDGRAQEESRRGFDARWIRGALAEHPVAVVPGFFATDAGNAIVSLGRGGSDLTAVLLAKGLEASRCELVKDVPGYFSSDPKPDPRARHLPSLTFDEALALADSGCDLVQRKAIEAAARYGLPLVVRSLEESGPVSRITGTQGETRPLDPVASGAVAP